MTKRTFLFLLLVTMLTGVAGTLHAQRYVGGDISMLPYYEAANVTYKDNNGTAISGDLIAYLKEQGWNSMRVRLFVDPSGYKTSNGDTYWNEGARQDIDVVKSLGKRIKDAGLKFLLDIHYSDTWTDPDKHLAPTSWSSDNYSTLMYSYTKEVLETLVAYGATPDFIQVGNEVNNGMLWDNISASSATNKCYANSTGTVMTNFISYIKQGCTACREVCPSAKIIFHVAMDYNATLDYANWAAKTWPATLATNEVDYDIIGLSYYPYYHGPLNYLTTLLTYLKTNFPAKEVQLVEVGYPHSNYPSSNSYNYTNTADTYGNTYAATNDGQLAFTNALITALKAYPQVTGLYWWFPEANDPSTTVKTDGWYNYGLWDNGSSMARAALYVLDDFVNNGYTVGANDNSTAWLGATSTIHTVEDGGSLHYTFTQTTAATYTAQGFLLYAGTKGATVSDANASILVEGCAYDTKNSTGTFTNDFTWGTDNATFLSEMNGATVDMYVTNINGTFKMTSTVTPSGASSSYTYTYSLDLGSTTDLDVCLSVYNACLTVTTDEYEPPYTYFNDFETVSGTTAVNAGGNATITGSGSFTTDSNTDFGTVFQNASGGIRSNYLLLPSDVLSHSAYTKELSIGFWVNKSSATDYFYTPIFTAHDKAPYSGTLSDNNSDLVNDWTMLACESRCWSIYNLNSYSGGYSDLTDAQNDATSNAASTAWLDDGKWHYYTFTMTATSVKVYVDGDVKNSWTIDASAFFSAVGNLTYVTLGGNQYAAWVDNDPAFAFDDVMIANRALSATEIAAIVNAKTSALNVNKAAIIANNGDITSLINGDFQTDASGWTGGELCTVVPTRSWRGTNYSNNHYELTSGSGTLSYTLQNMPAGTYKVVAAARANNGTITPQIAGTNGTALTGVADTRNENSTTEINTNGVEMPYSSLGGFTTDDLAHNWRWISATGTLASDGDLVINFVCAGGTWWMAIDDVHLYCTSLDGTSYTRTVGDGEATINTGTHVVTADIVVSNPNTVLRTTGAITTAAGENMNNDQYNSTRITKLVLYDEYEFTKLSNEVGTDYGAILYRSIPANTWCTLTVPFWPTTTLTMKYPSSFSYGTLTFSDVDREAWGGVDKPMLIKSERALTAIEGKIASTSGGGSGVSHSTGMTSGAGVPMQGVYTSGYVPQSTADINYYALGNDNNLHKVTGTGVTIAPFRAYFTLTNANNARSVISLNFNDEASGTSAPLNDNGEITNDKFVYNLSGQRFNGSWFLEPGGRAERTINGSGLKPGLYIVNGKKVVIK